MTMKNISTVTSRKGAKYHVQWDARTRKVYVKKISGFWTGWTRCDATAKTTGEATDVAGAFVRQRD